MLSNDILELCAVNGCCYLALQLIDWYSALRPVLAGTRAQSGNRYVSGTLHSGQVLRGSLPLLSPTFTILCIIFKTCCNFPLGESYFH
jgi:hypothetical protein